MRFFSDLFSCQAGLAIIAAALEGKGCTAILVKRHDVDYVIWAAVVLK